MQLSDRNRRDTDGLVKNSIRVGRVVEVRNDDTGAFARVQYNDRQNLITKDLLVGQSSAGGRRGVKNYRVGQEVLVAHLSNSIEDGVVLCGLFTPTNPPPAGTDPQQVIEQFDDGSVVSVDPRNGSLVVDFKGPVTVETLGNTLIKANNITIEAPTITLKGDVKIDGNLSVDGNIENTGNMDTDGRHLDQGRSVPHSGG